MKPFSKKQRITAGLLLLASLAAVWMFCPFRPFPSDGETAVPPPAVPVVSSSPQAAAEAPPEQPAAQTEQEPVASEPCSEAAALLVSTNATQLERYAALKKIEGSLSPADVSALSEFLAAPLTDFSRSRPRGMNAVKTDVLGLLMEQKDLPSGLGRQVAEMYNNPDTDYMWREYCLQFMAEIYEKQSKVEKSKVGLSCEALAKREGRDAGESKVKGLKVKGSESARSASSADELSLLRNALLSALSERDKDLAATALIGLSRLPEENAILNREELLQKATEIAADPLASERCRLTALRMASVKQHEAVLPVARNLVKTARTDLLKSAAIVSLGDFAQEEDRALLTPLTNSANRQIAAAARMALAKMEKEVNP